MKTTKEMKIDKACDFYLAASALKASLPKGVRGAVDVHQPGYYLHKCKALHIEQDNSHTPVACFAVTKQHELATLIKKPGCPISSIYLMSLAYEAGARWCYCLDTDKLRQLYTDMHFVRAACTPWDADLAPTDWDTDKYGRPCIAFYVAEECIKDKDATVDGKLMFPSWDAAYDYVARNTTAMA